MNAKYLYEKRLKEHSDRFQIRQVSAAEETSNLLNASKPRAKKSQSDKLCLFPVSKKKTIVELSLEKF